uniref:Ionotropic glutamate receptor C-terminal domain-containing protein n=1 Tax=Daphnia galeata TaxID=27404 RepID=A0A8J2W1J0_9CRUS|nr:unnamed protein product [Daphnia galeata]
MFLARPTHFTTITIIVGLLLITNVNFTTEANLSGLHFNLIVFHSPPFDVLIPGPNGTFTYTGSSVNIYKWLKERLNFTYSMVLLNETLIKKMGTHDAAFNLLQNDNTLTVVSQNCDGIINAFYLTMDRAERFDYTASAWSEGFSFAMPRPGEESRLFAFVGPFQPRVWISIFISLIFVVGTMTFLTWFYNRRWNIVDSESNNQSSLVPLIPKSNYTLLGSHMIYLINTITNQGGREAYSRTSFRVLTGIWVLCATVLINSYTGIVTSSLTTPKLKPSINTLEELAASKEIKIVIRSDISTGVQILQAKSGIYKVLGDQVRSEPDRIFSDPFKLQAKLETGHFAYPFLNSFSIAFVGSQYKKDKKCRFKVSKILPLSHGHYSLLFKKGSLYTKTFSKGILEIWEAGLVRFWVKNLPTIPKADECLTENKRKVSRLVPIQLSDLTSAFLILGIGIGLATLVFLLETIYSKLQRYKRRTKK